jgi:hypothetical protein
MREGSGVTVFLDDDRGYLRWLNANPAGFVVNSDRKPTPGYLRLHRATCPMISGRPSNGAAWTVTSIKVCGGREELATWAVTDVGGQLQPCPRCM